MVATLSCRTQLHWLTRALAGVTIVAMLVGCGSTVATATPGPTSTPPVATAAPSPTPAPSPTTSPGAAATVSSVAGTGTCPSPDLGGATTDADAVTHYRGGMYICRVTTGDPRVNGIYTAPWNMDMWGTFEDGAVVVWGTSRIENAGGAWEGTGSGVGSSDRGDIMAFWYKGTGGYAGLGLFELWTGRDPWTIRGQIFPGDPPDLTGLSPVTGPVPSPNVPANPTPVPVPTAGALAYGPVSVVQGRHSFTSMNTGVSTAGPGGVTHYRDGTFTGVDRANDPRASFTWKGSPWAMDIWGSLAVGGGIEWGPDRGENASGAWECSGSGIFDAQEGDTIVIWCAGTGGYAGLSYFELITVSDPFGLIPSDNTNRLIHGQIFPGDPPTP